MIRSASLGARVSPEVLDAAKRCAKDEFRSVAGLTEMLLVQYLQERGYLPKDQFEAPAAKPPATRRAKG